MSQIRIVSINRERSRFLVCPFVMSWGINRVTDRFFRSLKGPGVTAGDVGGALLDAFAFIERVFCQVEVVRLSVLFWSK